MRYVRRKILQSLFLFSLVFVFGAGCGTVEPVNMASGNPYHEIVNPSGFVNSEPFQLADFIGKKVILLDIMTYSCINCQRTYPYLNTWFETYEDEGFMIVGIHTPEFAFEKKIDNVRDAAERYGLKFPIVLDNDYGTWNAYNNRYWPRKYLIDIHGNIVYDHIGEGGYDKTEAKIQELLAERKQVLSSNVELTTDMSEVDAEVVAPSRKRSPETYFGSLRNRFWGEEVSRDGTMITFAKPAKIQQNNIYLVGTWDVQPEYAEAISDDARIVYGYTAQKVFLVMSSEEGGVARVYQDDRDVGDVAGRDVKNSELFIQNEQLYRIINNGEEGTHVFDLRVQPGVRAFAFTFG